MMVKKRQIGRKLRIICMLSADMYLRKWWSVVVYEVGFVVHETKQVHCGNSGIMKSRVVG